MYTAAYWFPDLFVVLFYQDRGQRELPMREERMGAGTGKGGATTYCTCNVWPENKTPRAGLRSRCAFSLVTTPLSTLGIEVASSGDAGSKVCVRAF